MYQVLIYVGFAYVCFTWFIWRRKQGIDHMQGMMSTMSVSMMIGLIGGLILGDVYRGDLYVSTLWGMLAGGLSGFLLGVPLSILSIVEGILSGVMAGMMGAMLGEMVPSEKVEPLLFVFVMLYTVCMLLVAKLIDFNIKETKWSSFFHHPGTPAVLLLAVFFWFQSLPFPSPALYAGDRATEITLTAVDFSYKPNQFTVKKDTEIKVVFQNDGNVEHDIEVVSHGKIVTISESSSEHHHGTMAEGVVHLHAKPGESVETVWKALEEGIYEFYCTIPGHKESGMIGRLQVTG
ncbi:cupredoxin domain-containing protein [Brevibacillus brevis]|uniref:Copper-binding protein n=1 Tax=Brevibacillus brevis TaxID=1393 RepID=A0A517IGU0_BREBE|nr:cupredoxin domain-containing protein [Brevibacillus brevis]QDS38111.1 copper-binding protein [Brevibacillus brevis]